MITIMGLIIISGCAKTDKYDINNILMNQKIVFIISVSSYAAGYFLTQKDKSISLDFMINGHSNPSKKEIPIFWNIMMNLRQWIF